MVNDLFSAISWGDPGRPPVLMIHGFMDSAATFIPLVENLPDKYYYVSFDFPGKFYISALLVITYIPVTP
jgi:hypothetical protein